jgi:hypothetical protein
MAQNISEVVAAIVPGFPIESLVTTGIHLRQKCGLSQRLFARRAGVHIDLHADRHFDDPWSLPGHLGSPLDDRQIAEPKRG